MDDFLGELAIAAMFSRAFAVVFLVAVLLTAVWCWGSYYGSNEVMAAGVDHGYVVWCEGDLVWKGECNE